MPGAVLSTWDPSLNQRSLPCAADLLCAHWERGVDNNSKCKQRKLGRMLEGQDGLQDSAVHDGELWRLIDSFLPNIISVGGRHYLLFPTNLHEQSWVSSEQVPGRGAEGGLGDIINFGGPLGCTQVTSARMRVRMTQPFGSCSPTPPFEFWALSTAVFVYTLASELLRGHGHECIGLWSCGPVRLGLLCFGYTSVSQSCLWSSAAAVRRQVIHRSV